MLTRRILTLQWLIAFLMVSGGLLIVGAGGEGVLDDSVHLAKEVE
jgi:hypothetical protein